MHNSPQKNEQSQEAEIIAQSRIESIVANELVRASGAVTITAGLVGLVTTLCFGPDAAAVCVASGFVAIVSGVFSLYESNKARKAKTVLEHLQRKE